MASGEWYERDDGSFWSIAGYDSFGDSRWHDVEGEGATPAEESGLGAAGLDRVTIHYSNPETGDDIYFTLHGPFEDYDQIDDFIGEALGAYGIAA